MNECQRQGTTAPRCPRYGAPLGGPLRRQPFATVDRIRRVGAHTVCREKER